MIIYGDYNKFTAVVDDNNNYKHLRRRLICQRVYVVYFTYCHTSGEAAEMSN